jgi:hypothetical protein
MQGVGQQIPGKTGALVQQGGRLVSTAEALPRGGPLDEGERNRLGDVPLSPGPSTPDISPLNTDLRPSSDLGLVGPQQAAVPLTKPSLPSPALSRTQTPVALADEDEDQYSSRLLLEEEILRELERRRWGG